MKSLTIVIGVATVLTATSNAAAAKLHVATNGNDAWSGALPDPNNTKTDGPFATLVRARDAIRELKKSGRHPGAVTVMVRSGTYYLAEPLLLGPEDSGTPGQPIAYLACVGEEVVLSGGRPITGWRKGEGNLWVADLPDVEAGKWYFRQLFVGGERQIRARTPNFDPEDPIKGGWAFVVPPPSVEGDVSAKSLVCIHTPGDTFLYTIDVLADGDYAFWMYYGAKNRPHGRTNMAGRTSISFDGGGKVLLDNLPDTGDWGRMKWSRTGTFKLSAGEHTMRWTNEKGGGLNWNAFALCDDPTWAPEGTEWAYPPAGKHLIIQSATKFESGKGKEWRTSASNTRGRRDRFHFRKGNIEAWPKSPEPEIHIFPAWGWVNSILSLDRVDSDKQLAYVKNRNCTQDLRLGNRYFVENVLEALDSPGEWYLDRAEGKLYYWPKRLDFQSQGVAAPALDRIIDLSGDVEGESEGQLRGEAAEPGQRKGGRRFVEHITLRGLTFRHTKYSLEMRSVYTPDDGAIGLRRTNHCTIQDCKFLGVGGYAVRLSLHSSDNHILGNTVEDAGQGGVLMVGYETAQQPKRNEVAGNYIHNCGKIWKHVAGVYVTTGSENHIHHNTVTDVPRYGISLKSFRKGSASHGNIVEYNRLIRTNLETNDTGAIETLGRDREDTGNVIRHNLILDSVGFKTTPEGEFLTPYYTWGIYLDDYSSGTTIYGNIVARTYRGGFHVHLGFNNVFENNIFVDGHEQQGEFNGRAEMRNNKFVRNVVCFRRGALLRVRSWDEKVITECDRNLYWQIGEDLGTSEAAATPKGTLAQWRAAGFDAHSLVADPLFVDPAKDDYRLKPESPAWQLGFQPIAVSKIGARGYESRK